MIVRLMRRYIAEPALALPALAAAAILVVAPDFGYLMALVVPLAGSFVSPKRPSRFEAALPISARTIVVARMLAAVALALLPLLVWMASTALRTAHGWPGVAALDAFGAPAWTTVRIAEATLGVSMGVVLPFAIRARELAPPPPLLVLAAWLAVGVVSAAVVYMLPAPVALLALACGTLLVSYVTVQRIPAAVATASLTVGGESPASRPATAAGTSAPHRRSARWRWPLMHATLSRGPVIGGIVLVVASAVSGMTTTVYLCTMVVMGTEAVRQRTRWMQPMPLSHRARLWCVLVPTVLASTLCISLGRWLPHPFSTFQSSLYYGAPQTYKPGERYFNSPTKVPLQYWHRAPAGHAPTIIAPWGETSPAFTFTLPGRVVLYNPYSSVRTSSERFVDWQFARATIAVYDHAIPRAQYDPINGPLPHQITDGLRLQLLDGSLLLLIGLMCVLLCELPRWHRLQGAIFVQVAVPVLAFVPMIVAILVDLVWGTLQGGIQVVAPTVQLLLMALVQRLPDSLAAVFLVAALPVLALYAVLEWLFARTETAGAVQVVRV